MTPLVNDVQQFATGAFYWEQFSPEIKTDLSCAAWRDGDAVALIDPVPLTMSALYEVVRRVNRVAVLLTNANHERGAQWFRARFSLEIWAHLAAEPDLKTSVQHYFDDGASLPGGLRAIHLPGSSASETAFFMPNNGGIVFVGDALVNMSSSGLAFLPDKYSKDPAQSRQSLRKLLALDFEKMTFAHGQPIVHNAKARLTALLETT